MDTQNFIGSTGQSSGMRRSTKIIGIILLLIAVGVAYWLVSPLFREIILDEPLPPFGDAMEVMSDQQREEFHRQVEALRGTGAELDEAMPTGPAVLARGDMQPRAHTVSGRALILDAGASRFLRFEDLDTVNGPDLRIYLSKDLSDDDVIDLGPIRATNGNVNYELPPGVDIGEYRYALIWCRAFTVLFSFADLQ